MSKWGAVISLVILGAVINTSVMASCYEDYDKFKGIKLTWCGAWGTGGEMLGGLGGLDPIPYHKTTKSGDEMWLIKLISSQKEWLDIRAGDNISFMIDGELFEIIINENSSKKVDSSNSFNGVRAVESVVILSSYEFFNKLAQANDVQFALYTSKARIERTMHKATLEHYADLLEKVKNLQKGDL